MGDSFSAGNGANNYTGAKGCRRSRSNYGGVMADSLAILSVADVQTTTVACSGAVTRDFLGPQAERSVPPQYSALSDPSAYDLILLTIGGNDVGFASIVQNCFVFQTRDAKDCNGSLKSAESKINGGSTKKAILDVVSGVAGRTDADTRIGLLGYPFLEATTTFELRNGKKGKPVKVGARVRQLQATADKIETDIVRSVNLTYPGRIKFFSTQKLFSGHELHAENRTLDSKERWFIKPFVDLQADATDNFYHPNVKGWAAEGNMLAASTWIQAAFAEKDMDPTPDTPTPSGLELGPSATNQFLPPELSFDGNVLLHDSNCYGELTRRPSIDTKSVGDDNICFTNDMTADGKQVFFPQYSRRGELVSTSQKACPDPQGYVYRWDTSGTTRWIDLAGECHYQAFAASGNGRFLVTLEGESGQRMFVHDLNSGSATEIAPPCKSCLPLGVTDNGNRVAYVGPTPLIDASGEVAPERTEQALFIWDRATGSRLVAGGDQTTSSIHDYDMSADGSVVVYAIQPEDGSGYRYYRWSQSLGQVQLEFDPSQVNNVSISANGGVVVFTYYDRSQTGQGVDQVGVVYSGSNEVVSLKDLGVASNSRYGVVSGDGSILAFTTEDALLPSDQDSSSAYDNDADWYFMPLPR